MPAEDKAPSDGSRGRLARTLEMMTDLGTLRADLNTALNEATLVSAVVDEVDRKARITLAVRTLPEEGPPSRDPRVMIVLAPLGRICASLRDGRWNDAGAPVQPFVLPQLTDIVRSFHEQPIYGWDFIDSAAEDDYARWGQRLSLDVSLGSGDGLSHTLDLFQESATGSERHLDLRFWFDRLYVFKPSVSGELVPIPLEVFAADGRRWWQGLRKSDPRTVGQGIVSGTGMSADDLRRLRESLGRRRPSDPH